MMDLKYSDPFSRLYDAGIEQALLGAILINNRIYDAAASKLQDSDFGNALHGRIFAEIGRLIQHGRQANPVTLNTTFENDSALGCAPVGTRYLVQLAEAGVTAGLAEGYVEHIVDLARRRAIIVACQDAIADAAVPDIERPASAVVEKHERQLAEIAEGHDAVQHIMSLGEAVSAAVAAAEAAYKHGRPHLRTGLTDLDWLIGGLLPGDLEVIAGRPAMGKTALALGVAVQSASDGLPAIYFSLEQPTEQLAQRVLSRGTGISASRQQRGELDDVMWPQYLEEARRISNLPIYIDDTPALSSGQICARIRRAKRRAGIAVAIVDHLQLIREDTRQEGRRLEIDHITGSFKALAKELKIPVVLLSQLSRHVEHREDKRPALADLRESGGIEQDGDRVIFVYREEYYLAIKRDRSEKEEQRLTDVQGLAELIVAKDRHGRGGSVTVHWDGARTMFTDLAR